MNVRENEINDLEKLDNSFFSVKPLFFEIAKKRTSFVCDAKI
jgi:hypothetical protein